MCPPNVIVSEAGLGGGPRGRLRLRDALKLTVKGLGLSVESLASHTCVMPSVMLWQPDGPPEIQILHLGLQGLHDCKPKTKTQISGEIIIYSGTLFQELNLSCGSRKDSPHPCSCGKDRHSHFHHPMRSLPTKTKFYQIFCLRTKLFTNKNVHELRYHCNCLWDTEKPQHSMLIPKKILLS